MLKCTNWAQNAHWSGQKSWCSSEQQQQQQKHHWLFAWNLTEYLEMLAGSQCTTVATEVASNSSQLIDLHRSFVYHHCWPPLTLAVHFTVQCVAARNRAAAEEASWTKAQNITATTINYLLSDFSMSSKPVIATNFERYYSLINQLKSLLCNWTEREREWVDVGLKTEVTNTRLNQSEPKWKEKERRGVINNNNHHLHRLSKVDSMSQW